MNRRRGMNNRRRVVSPVMVGRRRRRRRAGGLFPIIIILLIIAAVVFFMNRDSSEEVQPPQNTNTPAPSEPPQYPNTEPPSEVPNDDNANTNPPAVNNTLREQYSMIVWLDAGHGGIDGGTAGILNDVTYLEKDIVLDITMMVYEMFANSDSGIKALLTRDSDVYVHRFDRPSLWNDVADLMVSIHLNFYEGPTAQYVYGIEVYYNGNSTENTGRVNITNAQFAQIIQDHLVRETGARDRRIRGYRNYIITNASTMPAVIVEAGFMSSQGELALLVTREYQMQIATAIYNGIVEAFGFGVR